MRIFGIVHRIRTDLPDERLLQRLEKLRRDLLSDRDLIDIDADLSAVAELEKCDFACSITDVGILADDAPVSGFAAEFQCDRRQILCRLLHHMHSDARRAGVEDFVKPLRKTEIGDIMPAVNQRDIFLRIQLREHLLHDCRTARRFGACLDDSGVSASERRGQDTECQQHRKIKRADNQRDAVGHLVDLCHGAGKTLQTAEMNLRLCPFPDAVQCFIDLRNRHADIEQIGFGCASAEVCLQRGAQAVAVGNDLLFEPCELPDAESDRQCLACLKESALFFDSFMDVLSIPHSGFSFRFKR